MAATEKAAAAACYAHSPRADSAKIRDLARVNNSNPARCNLWPHLERAGGGGGGGVATAGSGGGGELAVRPGCERRRDWRQRGGPSASSSPHSSRGLPLPWQLRSQAAPACSARHPPQSDQACGQTLHAAELRAALERRQRGGASASRPPHSSRGPPLPWQLRS